MTKVIEFNLPLSFGEKVQATKAWTYNQKWEAVTKEALMKMSLGQLAMGEGRFVIECLVEGKPCRVVTHDEDYQQIRAKYPGELCIHVRQVYEIFAETMFEQNTLPRLLLPLGILNARVESRGDYGHAKSLGKSRRR